MSRCVAVEDVTCVTCWEDVGSGVTKTVSSAAVKPEEIWQEEDANMLDEAEKMKFRRLAATLNYMSLDRSDVIYATKEHRELEEAEEGSPISERSGKGRGRCGQEYDEMKLVVHVDSEWATGPERKPTSGGMMMINGTVVNHWSRTQATRVLSTADAE